MRALVLVAAVVIVAGAWDAAAGAQNASPRGDPQAGERLALRVCDACHIVASHQELPPVVPRYAPSFFDIARRPGTTARSLDAFLAHPHPLGQMPFPGLTPTQRADVGAYILSLRGRR
jgi:mono/diheme cytochrome c family protein